MNTPRLVVAGLLIGLALPGCNSTKTTSTETKEPAKQATSERKERYRHSTQMGSWFMEKKKQAPTSEADSAAARAALEEAQRRGMRPVRDGGN